MRNDNLAHTTNNQRLTEKAAELQRKFDITAAAEAGLKREMKTAEATIRGLKDELARTKALVGQTRLSCANEVRRRDRQIDTLKKQVAEAGRARGVRTNPAITSIIVSGEIPTTQSTVDEDRMLQEEAQSSMAKLSRDLNRENEAILVILNTAMEQLREMSGWQRPDDTEPQVRRNSNLENMTTEMDMVMGHMRHLLTNPSFVPVEEVTMREEEITRLKTGWVKMENRWKDAVHLIDGWRKRMSTSGQPICEADLQMGLRLSPVRVRNVRETQESSEFGLASVDEGDEEEEEEGEGSLVDSQPASATDFVDGEVIEDFDESDSDSSNFDDEHEYDEVVDAVDEVDEASPDVSMEDQGPEDQDNDSQDVQEDAPPIQEQPQLKNSVSAGNRFGTIKGKKELTTSKPITEDAPKAPQGATAGIAKSATTITRQTRIPTQLSRPIERRTTSRPEATNTATLPTASKRSVTEGSIAVPKTRSRLETPAKVKDLLRAGAAKNPLLKPQEPLSQGSPITMTTIAAKLAASERDADAARVRAKLKAAQLRKPSGTAPPQAAAAPASADKPLAKQDDAEVENGDPVKQEPVSPVAKPEKRKREVKASMRASRRRSTLSPWELETLMTGRAQGE